MDIETAPQVTTRVNMSDEEPVFRSNGLLSDANIAEPESATMTAREELEMMTSNGILDESLEDAEVLRNLGDGGLSRTSAGPAATTILLEKSNAPEETETLTTDTQEEFSGNGLLFGGMTGSEAEPETTGASNVVSATTPIIATEAVETRPERPVIVDDFQGNGILSGNDLPMDDEPMLMEELTASAPTLDSIPTTDTGFQANGLLGDSDPLPAVALNPSTAPKTVAATAVALDLTSMKTKESSLGTSSLDQLLDDLDSAGYTTSEKGKGRAGPVSPAAGRFTAITTTRVAPPILPEPETPTSAESMYPHMNLVTLTKEAEKLMPLEALDHKGRKVVFKRRPRKVVDGRGVSGVLPYH